MILTEEIEKIMEVFLTNSLLNKNSGVWSTTFTKVSYDHDSKFSDKSYMFWLKFLNHATTVPINPTKSLKSSTD